VGLVATIQARRMDQTALMMLGRSEAWRDKMARSINSSTFNTRDTRKSGRGFVRVTEGLPGPGPAYTLPATRAG
jgi:hypothetical protein